MSFSGKSKYFRGKVNWKYRGRGKGKGSSLDCSNTNKKKYGQPGPSIDPSTSGVHTQPLITAVFPTTPVPGKYKGWRLYHPQEKFMQGSPTVNKTEAVEAYLQRSKQFFNPEEIEERRHCSLDFKHILQDTQFLKSWPNFESDLSDEPEYSISCLGLAVHQYTLKGLEKDVVEEEVHSIDLPAIRVRILNYEPITQLKNLKANLFGKLVCVRGTIIRVGNMKLLCTWMGFQCNTCNSVQTVRQPDGVFTQPTVCASQACRARSFTPLCSSHYTQTLNWQTVRLQELVDDDQIKVYFRSKHSSYLLVIMLDDNEVPVELRAEFTKSPLPDSLVDRVASAFPHGSRDESPRVLRMRRKRSCRRPVGQATIIRPHAPLQPQPPPPPAILLHALSTPANTHPPHQQLTLDK